MEEIEVTAVLLIYVKYVLYNTEKNVWRKKICTIDLGHLNLYIYIDNALNNVISRILEKNEKKYYYKTLFFLIKYYLIFLLTLVKMYYQLTTISITAFYKSMENIVAAT